MSNILRFCDGFQEASFEAGTTILKQGVKSKSVYIIIDGAVEVSADDAHVKILSEPGTVFGELAALLDEPRIANVIATQDCRCYVMDDISQICDLNEDAFLELTRGEFDRLFDSVNLLLHFLQQFTEEAEKLGVDLGKVEKISTFLNHWKEQQDSFTESFPFLMDANLQADKEIQLAPGDTLYSEGDRIEPFYALKEGTVTHSRADQKFSIDISTPGTVLNMGLALVNCETMSTLTAKAPSVVLEVSDVRTLFKKESTTGLELLTQVAERIAQLTNEFIRLKQEFLSIDEGLDPQTEAGIRKLVNLVTEKEKKLHQVI